MMLLTAIFGVTACLLSLTPEAHGAFAVSSKPHHSHACFGSTGLVQTSNFIDCDPFSKLPRICIRYVAYGSKMPRNGNITCPAGVSSEVDPVCCRPLSGDCIVKINITETFELQKECSHQTLSSCRISVDQRMDDKFLRCTRTFRSSTFRYINYVCIIDSDADARAMDCYVKPPSTKSTTTTTTISTTVKPIKSRSPAQSSANGLTPLSSILPVPDASTTERTRYHPVERSEPPTTTTTNSAGGQTTSGLSQDEKIIIGISVSAMVLIVTVIVVMAVRAFHKRSLMRKRNAWVAHKLNGDLNNRNSKTKIVTTDEGTPYNGEKQPPTESGTIYEEISEVPADLVTTKPVKKQAPKKNGQADVNSPVNDNLNLNNHANSDNNNAQNPMNVDDGQNQDELIAMKSLNLNNKNIDEKPSMMEIKSIGNHQYQEVGLSPKNPLYKLNGFANSDNRAHDAKTRMIVDKISNTDQINVFRKNSKHRKGAYREGYDSDNGTLRRVAKFVKKCIRDIDTTDEPTTGKSKKRRRRNSESEIPHLTRHNKVSGKRKNTEKSIVVKPWDFIRGDKLRNISDDNRGPFKSSLMKKKKNSENDANYRNRRKKVDDNEMSQSSENSSYEEVPCRFPVRKASFMKRKNRKNADTDSMLSSMESDNSNSRNLEVRFHNKLTYISPEKRDKTPRRDDDQNRRRNKKYSDNGYAKSARTKTERKERNKEDKTTKSRDLNELEGSRVNNRRRHKEESITRDDEGRRSLRKINSHRDSSRTDHKVRRNSTKGNIRTTPATKRVSLKSKHKSHKVSNSRGKHSSKGTHHHSKRSTKVYDQNYDTDSDENTDSSSQEH